MSILNETTSGGRPTNLGVSDKGKMYFETDTNNIAVWDGTSWRGYANDGASGWSGTNAYSLNLDGTDDRVEIDSVVTSSATAGTVSAWVKTSVILGSQFVLTQTDKTATGNNVYISFSLSNQNARLQWVDRKSTRPELQSHSDLVCRLLLEKKKKKKNKNKKIKK